MPSLLCAALMAMPMASSALTFRLIEVTCPLDGSVFKFNAVSSGTSFGMYLDMQPFGPIAAPLPSPKCPSSGFVIYKDNFTDSEIAQLKTYVETPEYQTLRTTHSDYYVAATVQRLLNEDAHMIAATLLRATWRAFGDQYARYATEALNAYQQLLQQPGLDRKRWLTYQLLAGELERRLGHLDAADSRFAALFGHPVLTERMHRDIVDLQRKLIAARDASGMQQVPTGTR